MTWLPFTVASNVCRGEKEGGETAEGIYHLEREQLRRRIRITRVNFWRLRSINMFNCNPQCKSLPPKQYAKDRDGKFQ